MLTEFARRQTVISLWVSVLLLGLLISSAFALVLSAEAQREKAGERGNMLAAAPLPDTSTQTRAIAFTYDAAARLTQASYGGNTIAYTYDAGGNLLSVSPDGGYEIYLPLVMR